MRGRLKTLTKATSISAQVAKNPKLTTTLLRSNQESCSRPKSRRIDTHKPRPKSFLLRLNTLFMRRKQALPVAQIGRKRFKLLAVPRTITRVSIRLREMIVRPSRPRRAHRQRELVARRIIEPKTRGQDHRPVLARRAGARVARMPSRTTLCTKQSAMGFSDPRVRALATVSAPSPTIVGTRSEITMPKKTS